MHNRVGAGTTQWRTCMGGIKVIVGNAFHLCIRLVGVVASCYLRVLIYRLRGWFSFMIC